jgi:diguanylate cyclase (GGDEF)-like protein
VAYSLFYGLVVGFTAGAVIVAAAGVAAVGVLGVLRVRPWLRGGGHVLLGILYTALVALAYHTGGLASVILPWLVTPPIFAILLLGRRGAAGWTALCVLTIVAFHAAGVLGVRFPVGVGAEWAPVMTLGSYAGLVSCTALLTFVFEDIRARAHARAESASTALAKLAYHDPVTGLVNRARFLECLGAALGRAHEAGDPARVAVLLLDLDGFKLVNDAFGHATGDAVLAQVAGRLLNATRGCDTVARFGGDEFVVLLDGVREDASAQRVAERIVASLALPFDVQGTHAVLGGSVGIARGSEPPAWHVVAEACGTRADVATLLHDADVAMYRAKASGKGRWVQFEPGMHDTSAEPPPLAAPRWPGSLVPHLVPSLPTS